MELKINQKISVESVLENLDKYRPRRKGWTWRKKGKIKLNLFEYSQCSPNLKNSIPLPSAKYFNNIDPQPDCVITTEIASGSFENDIRRMRMAAWHGADHIMVIRTTGQSHFDGLIEGTPEGVGGVPITRKQVRATRKALDFIEDEVGRPINFHSYISGVAGPEIAVMFAEDGVNGAHQDPQYNVLYRNINMVRSFVDAAEAKKIMAGANLVQIDGAHNANATALFAWKVMPELLVQHAINCTYSVRAGMKKSNISLSTVPPTASPAPCLRIDLPYAVALRDLFKGYRMRAQMNTRYIESDVREATVTHTLNVLISRLTSADIQSSITPDEGRNVPWHYNNIRAINTAKQALVALDGINEIVEIKKTNKIKKQVRELKERAVLFMEEILALGGYFAAVEKGIFVDSGFYPERGGDGIARNINGGSGVDTVVKRDKDYLAPVCGHFGKNNLQKKVKKTCDLIGGCTLCNPEKIKFIDELDPEDNVNVRLSKTKEHRDKGLIRPEVERYADGTVLLEVFLPVAENIAEAAGLEIAKKMNMENPEIIHKQVMHPVEGTFLEIKGKVEFDIDPQTLVIPEKAKILSAEEIRADIKRKPLKIVAATVGEDEHSVGLREIIDIKHGGLEGFGVECHYLGTYMPIEKLVNAAIEIGAEAILISTIITHGDIHKTNMKKLHNYCIEKGIRKKVVLVAGGTQVTDAAAKECGLDKGFGRGTKGIHVASFLVSVRKKS